ncbi:MAG: hypothetical protein M3123_00090 [Actinomycetota bacterium]|nr:hypothetical protein [Actinomycetota bacterium]
MTSAVRILVFVLVAAAIFAAAAALGRSVGPLERRSGHETPEEAHAAATSLPGLAVATGGLRLVPAKTVLRTGKRDTFSFRIVRRELEPPVRDFDIEHARRMHLIVVRRDLTGFQHLHPTMRADGAWTTTVRVAAPGAYRAFADFSTRGRRITLGVDIFAAGAWSPRVLPAPAPFATTGPYRVALRPHYGAGGSPAVLRFDVFRRGVSVRPDSYLGARGYLVILREGDLAYLHAHADDDTLQFETTYPSSGRYRLFLQFAHAGRVRTVAFTEWPR